MENEINLLTVSGVKKYYVNDSGTKQLILDDVNFIFNREEGRGRIKTILAPYGAGKSTLLKIVSSLLKADEGSILLGGKEYNKPDGQIIYIPEKASSFPWLNVRDNIKFVLTAAGKDIGDINNLISMVGLTGYEEHFPHSKSLGFRFRISLARALSLNPKLILIDDSFKNMTPETRNEIYRLVKDISREVGVNFLAASTNIHEAIFLSDEILLMRKNPGTIFKDLKIQNRFNSAEFAVTEDVISFRNEIENSFRGEDIMETISFSI